MSALDWQVPFNRPTLMGNEFEYLQEAILKNGRTSGNGPFTKACEAFLSDYYQTEVLLVTSCTHALEMAALLLDLSPDDEVILPSYTFVSTANAFVLRGCQLRFAECGPDGQIDLDAVRALITPRTKAVCVVHYAGNSTPMDTLAQLCKQHELALIEDAAQAVSASYNGKLLGTWGDFGCLSFHETKNISCGEGGALMINRPDLVERAAMIREHGTNRQQFLQGKVSQYTWVDLGSSYMVSEMNTAFLYGQLQHFQRIQDKRAADWHRYHQAIQPLLLALKATVIDIPPTNQSSYHIFGLLFETANLRQAFIEYMNTRRVATQFHYVALHSSPMGKQYATSGDMTNTDRLSDCLVRLPLFHALTMEQQTYVISCIRDFIG
jgi:dTDP-4-amino-4,6-dideoxygalactose transaminase